jgi:hypothetical protein
VDIEDEDGDGEEEEEVWRDLVIKKRRFWSCFGGRSFGAMKVEIKVFILYFFKFLGEIRCYKKDRGMSHGGGDYIGNI